MSLQEEHKEKLVLVFYENNRVIRRIDIAHSQTIYVGRAEDNDIHFLDKSVSKIHAKISYINGVSCPKIGLHI